MGFYNRHIMPRIVDFACGLAGAPNVSRPSLTVTEEGQRVLDSPQRTENS